MPKDVGLIEVYGISASTFTRTIKMGLLELGIPFVQVERDPHSQDIKARNKYGLLPVLVHSQDGLRTRKEDVTTLFESNAIRRYIDEYLNPIAHGAAKQERRTMDHLTPPLASQSLDSTSVIARAELDGRISTFSQTIFPPLEHSFIKPAAGMLEKGADKTSILSDLEQSAQRVKDLLQIVQDQATSRNQDASWIMGGEHLTWADLFLFPILDDLRVSPLSDLISGDEPTFTWLAAWMKRMDARSSVKETHHGTVAYQASRK